ncbi:GntR family transcriptional regulator [Sporolactobacillus sp. THM7-7]|nr:GntR family transcriptional regulator [Sporolactobacillus sp. THM7-7]
MNTIWDENNLLSVREHAYRHLKELILEGYFKPGDRLKERDLADKLKISRTPIREALFRLESQGFVKTVPRRGVIVSNISEEEVIEVFTILSSLEVLAVKLAAERIEPDMKTNLENQISELDALINGAEQDFENKNIETNLLIYRTAKSPRLYTILSGLIDYIQMSAHMGYETPGRKKESLKEHMEILKAIKNQEVELAEYLTKIHIANSKKAYVHFMKKVKEKRKKEKD